MTLLLSNGFGGFVRLRCGLYQLVVECCPLTVIVQQESPLEPEDLKAAVNQTMPFGKYKGRKLIELPEPYLVWFHQQGFPRGKLGEQLALMYEVKANGLEKMLKPLIKN